MTVKLLVRTHRFPKGEQEEPFLLFYLREALLRWIRDELEDVLEQQSNLELPYVSNNQK